MSKHVFFLWRTTTAEEKIDATKAGEEALRLLGAYRPLDSSK